MADRPGLPDDDRLVEVLASVADLLVIPDDRADHSVIPDDRADLLVIPDDRAADGAADAGRPGPGRRRPPAAVAAAAVAVVALAAVVTAVAPVREAVAGLLGLGSTTVAVDPDLDPGSVDPDLARLVDGLEPLADGEADAALGIPLPEVGDTALGPPQVVGRPPDGGVLAAWADGATTLWLRRAGAPPLELEKRVVAGTPVSVPAGLGDEALVITGDHLLVTPGRHLAATTVVLWTAGGLELRLESDLDPEALVDLARALTP